MRPLVGRNSVVSILMVVVFPAPFGSEKREYFFLCNVEADVINGCEISEFLTRWLTEIIPRRYLLLQGSLPDK